MITREQLEKAYKKSLDGMTTWNEEWPHDRITGANAMLDLLWPVIVAAQATPELKPYVTSVEDALADLERELNK